MSGPEVAVLGGTGPTGRRVVAALRARGARTVVVTRSPAAASAASTPDGEVRYGDFRDPSSLAAAVAGAGAVYIIPPTFQPDEAELIAAAAHACETSGVGRVVLHSVLHPHCPRMAHHLRKADGEDALRRTGTGWTILQPAMYVQTVTETLLSFEREGVVPVPWNPETALSPIDVGDVAEVAATVLLQPGHEYATYELAGPRPRGVADMVRVVADLQGRPLTAKQVPAESILPYPAGSAAAETLLAMCREYGEHGLLGNPRVVSWLLGRPPRDVAEVVRASTAL